MEAIKYKIKIYEGTMDFIHDGGQTIEEIYFPEINLTINNKAIFLGNREKSDHDNEEVIEIPDDIANNLIALASVLSTKTNLEEQIRKYLGI
jgi:uncharacterized UBP type Zn finger protein